ncbi:MAG: Trk system potassium transporter TrkA [Desulfobacterales bacterium]
MIIIGAGEVGFHIASRLSIENKDVVVIDLNPESLRRVSEEIDAQVLRGSGSSPIILEEAGIKEAEIMLALTDSDETNLVACLAANILSPTTKKLARIRNSDFDKYHETFREHAPHIDNVINPEIEVVKTIERLLEVPGAVDVGEFADGRMKLIGIRLDATARLAGIKLSDIKTKMGRRTLIAAVIRNEELIIPTGKDRLLPGDLVYFISEADKLTETLSAFDKHAQPLNRVLIIGGGRIGYRLASFLEKKSIYTKIIEKSPDRCAQLAEKMNKTVILCGDGSDQSLMLEENISEMDAVITLTDDEETNILVSLLARRMGVRETITKISKFSYFPLMSMIGIEQVVSPRLSAINTILQHIRKGKVLSAISIKGEEAEVLEAVALPTSDIVGKPLKDISFPKGALLIGIIHNDVVMMPSGDSVVEPDDRIIIFARRKAVQQIEKILTVKVEFF